MSYTVSKHPNPKYFLAWSGGLQSTTLLVMSALGDIRKVDGALFADLGLESELTYKIIDFYTKFAEERGIKVYKVSRGYIEDNLKDVPSYIAGGGMLRRQCTRKLKIEPMNMKIRELCGLRLDGKGRTKKETAILYLGISFDELYRIKEHSKKRAWIKNEHPLVDLKMTRGDCVKYLEEKNLPIPAKSSCLICPYRNFSSWRQLTEKDKQRAIEVDKKLRYCVPRIELYTNRYWLPIEEYFKKYIEENREDDACIDGYCWV